MELSCSLTFVNCTVFCILSGVQCSYEYTREETFCPVSLLLSWNWTLLCSLDRRCKE